MLEIIILLVMWGLIAIALGVLVIGVGIYVDYLMDTYKTNHKVKDRKK